MPRSRSAPGYYGAAAFVALMLVAYLGMAGVFWAQAPAQVPSHFNGANDVDDWSSKGSFLFTLSMLGVGLPILFAIPWPWGRWPGLLNVPNKNYWLESGRAGELTDRVATFMRLVGGLICGLMGALLVISLAAAAASRPTHSPPGWAFPLVIGLFLVGLGLGVVKLFRDLKPPEPSSGVVN